MKIDFGCPTLRRLPVALAAIGVLLLGPGVLLACTTGVISGKATVDGRPLLWKNRDTSAKNNQVVYLADGDYRAMAVITAGGTSSIWMGVNEAGFCIENSVTRDLSEKDAKGLGNGSFMKKALLTCATVEDFERLLRQTDGSRATAANFGVIDAEGGAVIFETSASAHQKFDANDPDVAPKGYVVRSNFSFTGSTEIDLDDPGQVAEIYSGGRFLRGCSLVDMALADGGASVTYLLQHNTRDYADAAGNPFPGSVNGPPGTLPDKIDTTHTISRKTTVSAAVFHGVRPGEDPLLTTMWVMLGEPSFTVAVPCWVGTGEVAEELLGDKTSPICDAARALRDAAYVEETNEEGEETLFLHTSALPDIWARTLPAERRHLGRAAEAIERWRQDRFDAEEAAALHHQISLEVHSELSSIASALAIPR